MEHSRIYLPPNLKTSSSQVKEYLNRYIAKEFPPNGIYSVPKTFQKSGEKQAALAEAIVFDKLKSLQIQGLWLVFFHGITYGGHSFRNDRLGKLMIREHDFVVLAKWKDQYYIALLEVKSTQDHSSDTPFEKISDAKVIKNNKRSAQHQLRDHLEVLQNEFGDQLPLQNYIMWPFLTEFTTDPRQNTVKRWQDDANLHVFDTNFRDQDAFNAWFLKTVLGGEHQASSELFGRLLERFIVLSCGVFVDEIEAGLVAILTQEQLELLTWSKQPPMVVHGAAGTGKTLLVLKKLEQLHRTGRLNATNRALYICYWPGIRCEMELKLEKLGIREFVDTTRFYISIKKFLADNKNAYRHVFMDEAEAICLALDGEIMKSTLAAINDRYHQGNCSGVTCHYVPLADHDVKTHWGELWFMVDINQASMFLPKHSPNLFKTPTIILSKIMRSTASIFALFRQFYTNPMPLLPEKLQKDMKIPKIVLGHHISGPPLYWIKSNDSLGKDIAHVIIDLCVSKGFKPSDLCVIPFLVNEKLTPDGINCFINEEFVKNAFRPQATNNVEEFLHKKELNQFLVAWALRVKGLEFKVVVMAIDNDDFDREDAEDRKKAYIIASRCTCMLILVSNEDMKEEIDLHQQFEIYPNSISF